MQHTIYNLSRAIISSKSLNKVETDSVEVKFRNASKSFSFFHKQLMLDNGLLQIHISEFSKQLNLITRFANVEMPKKTPTSLYLRK